MTTKQDLNHERLDLEDLNPYEFRMLHHLAVRHREVAIIREGIRDLAHSSHMSLKCARNALGGLERRGLLRVARVLGEASLYQLTERAWE